MRKLLFTIIIAIIIIIGAFMYLYEMIFRPEKLKQILNEEAPIP